MTIIQDGKRSAAVLAQASAGEGDVATPFPDNAALDLRSRFRASMRGLASSVALLTARHDGKRGGLTATAACSLSVDPPLMLVCVNRRSNTHELIRKSEHFCINYLGEHQRELALSFAQSVGDADAKFATGAWDVSAFGTPILLDGIASIECRVHRRIDEGTHSIFIGAVLDVEVRITGEPLLYVQGDFAKLLPRE